MTAQREHDLLETFDERWNDYRKQFKVGRGDISEESIHDLRVAARRLQALLSIVQRLNGRRQAKKMQRFLRKQLSELDSLHDTQVMIQEVDGSMEDLPQLLPFKDFLQKRVDDLARTGRKNLRKKKPSDLEKRIKKIRRVIKRHAQDADLAGQLLQVVDGAYAEILTRFGKLDAGDPTTIHRVRIAFKKQRYMIETVEPVLPRGYPKDYFDSMHNYQEAMGKVHDTQVLLDTLKEYKLELQRRDQNKEPDLKPAEQYFRTRLADLIVAYFQCKDELYHFWRPAPRQPFPWEKSHDAVHRTTRNRRGVGSQHQRGAGQPTTSHRGGAKKVPADRGGTGQPGDADRPDPDKSVPTGS